MGHQAAVELDQQVVRQPGGDVGPCACCSAASGPAGRRASAAPASRQPAAGRAPRGSKCQCARRPASAAAARGGSGHSRRRARRRPRRSARRSAFPGARLAPATRWAGWRSRRSGSSSAQAICGRIAPEIRLAERVSRQSRFSAPTDFASARPGPLVRCAGRVEAAGEGGHRPFVQPRHQRGDRRRSRCRPRGTGHRARRERWCSSTLSSSAASRPGQRGLSSDAIPARPPAARRGGGARSPRHRR